MHNAVWRPSRPHWTASDGVVWKRQSRWLTEREAKRFVMRATGAVAIEHSGTHELTWVVPGERAAFWDAHAAGHVDGRDQPVAVNSQGVTFHVSVWKSATGERLVLFSEMC